MHALYMLLPCHVLGVRTSQHVLGLLLGSRLSLLLATRAIRTCTELDTAESADVMHAILFYSWTSVWKRQMESALDSNQYQASAAASRASAQLISPRMGERARLPGGEHSPAEGGA